MSYKPTIGLEIHVELKTKTKMFCDSPNDLLEKHPNIYICPICMGHPGTLPVINKEAVKMTVLAGFALNCDIDKETFFERKNYFYPDIPKGYQITQFQKPLCSNGYLEIESENKVKKIRIKRIHLEEDTGKLIHPEKRDYSLVDYNRAGVPLMELVTEPDFENGDEVRKFAEELQLICRYIGISDADMEKGQMRVEVNISISKNDNWGTKVEIKNLNSIRAAAQSVDYEIERQEELLESDKEIKQETRGWDENKRKTFGQRVKEGSADYRYFPEPDLPPLNLSDEFIEEVKSRITELPVEKRNRFKKEYNLPETDIEVLIKNKNLSEFFENTVSELDSWDELEHLNRPESEHRTKLVKLTANYIINDFKNLLGTLEEVEFDGLKINPHHMGEFVVRIFHKEISSTNAVKVLEKMFREGKDPGQIIEEGNLGQVSDVAELEKIVMEVISETPDPVKDYKSGKVVAIQSLIGKVMAKTKGKANPGIVKEIIEKQLV